MASGQDRLSAYRRRRDAARTPEPVPERPPEPRGNDDTFVIQEHHARRLHWDLRLERGGVLVSWAVPKGIPRDPKVNHLAVHTEDHPLEYATFEGEIPRGEYGGGRMIIWDRGTYETEKWSDREVKVVLHGNRVSGRYVLFQTDGRNWMIHRMDPPEDPDWQPLPERVLPMQAEVRERLPRDQQDYGFEVAWGGRRLLAYVEGGQARFTGGDGADTPGPTGLGAGLGEALGARPVVLDGEVAELDGQEIYMIYDLLHLDGHPLLDQPQEVRRRMLDGLALAGKSWLTAPWFPGEGSAVRQAARERGLPGIVAKRLDSPYEPGVRSPSWRFIPT